METWQHSRTAYRVKDGELTAIELPEQPQAAFTVPEQIATKGPNGTTMPVRLLSGMVDQEQIEHTIGLAHEIAVQLTPWATWYMAPACGCLLGTTSGSTWTDKSVAVIRTDRTPQGIVAITLHEAWHLSEEMISDQTLTTLDEQLAQGPAWPGDYYPQATERRARAFTAFGQAMVEGVRMTVQGPHVPHEISLFWHVYSGAFATEVMRARNKPAPGRLRRTLAAVWK